MSKVYKTSILITGDETQGVQALRNAERASLSLEKQSGRLGLQTDKLSKQTTSLNKNYGMAGIQVQQFFGQLQGGQSVMVALAQQSADLGIVLGAPMAGVIVSLGAVVAGTLLPSLMNAKDAMSELDEIAKKLEVSLVTTGDGVDVLSEHIQKLAERSDSLARLQISASIQDAEAQIKLSADGIGEAIDGILSGITQQADLVGIIESIGGNIDDLYSKVSNFDELPSDIILSPDQLSRLRTEIERTASKFDISNASASRFIYAIKQVEKDASALNIKTLENTISDLNDETDGGSKKLLKLAETLIPLFESSTEGSNKLNLLRKAFADLNGEIENSSESSEEAAKAFDKAKESLERQLLALSNPNSAEQLDIAKTLGLDSIDEIPPELQSLISKIQELKSETESLKFFEDTNQQLELQNEKLQLSGQEFAEYKIKMDGIAAGTAPELIAQLIAASRANDELKQSISDETALQKSITKNNEYLDALQEQVTLGSLFGEELAVETALRKLSSDATEDQRIEVEKLAKALYAQKQNKTENPFKQDDDFYKKAIEGVNGYSDAWSDASNVIINAFGNIGQQMEKLINTEDSYAKALNINSRKQKEAGADIAKLKAEEYQLNFANTQAQINSYAAIAGAAGDMFEENSKAAEIAHGIEQALAVASLAMSVEKMLMSGTETAAVVANEGVKQAALGTTAIINQGQADPYSAFARIAAMAAIVAGLGIATNGSVSGSASSSSDRQETQGTGTLLGSADKSQSILNSVERSEDLQLDQYAELRAMNTSLNDLNNNITSLVTNIVSSFGKFNADTYGGELGTLKQSGNSTTDSILESAARSNIITGLLYEEIGDPLSEFIIGSFSSTKKTLIDSGISIVSQTIGDIIESGLVESQAYFDIKIKDKSFWGLKSDTTYNTEYQDVSQQIQFEMGLIFSNIGDSITSAVDVLGLDVANNLENFVIDLPNISFNELSGDEIQEELAAVFSSQADLMATYLVPGLQDFQKVGEGLYETLIRIAQEQAVFNSVLEITGNTLNAIDAAQTIEATQAIIDFAGGIENLSDAASTFFSEFYSESEQFDYLQKQLTEQFAALGQTLPATADGFKDLVQGLNLADAADQKLYAQLLLLSGQSAEYYGLLDDKNEAQKEENELAAEALALKNESILSLKTEINELVDGLLNPATDYQSLIAEEEQRWQNQQDAADELDKTEMARYESAIKAEQTLDEYINGLAFSENSIFSSEQQQNLAQKNFEDAVARAQGGDYSAVSDATASASQYLELVKSNIAGTSHNEQRVFTDAFVSVNNTLSSLSDYFASVEAPEQQIIAESPELISLREQLAAAEAAAVQAENQALADLLASQLTELSDLSGDNIESLIDSMSIDITALGDLLSVNLLELIDVTKQSAAPLGALGLTSESAIIPVDNVVPFPSSSGQTGANQTASNTTTDVNNIVAELKLLREEVAAFRGDTNDNADDATAQRDEQITTSKAQLAEDVYANLRQVSVS